jgi:hypothetical protein
MKSLGPWPHQRQSKSRSKQHQVQVYLSPPDWLRLRRHAAAQDKPLAELVRELLRPLIDGLPELPER